MAALSYSRHRFPPAIIQHAIWLYLRFTLSYRNVEDLLAERCLRSAHLLKMIVSRKLSVSVGDFRGAAG
jgi:transposase-like protein